LPEQTVAFQSCAAPHWSGKYRLVLQNEAKKMNEFKGRRTERGSSGNLGERQEQAKLARWKKSSIIDRRPWEVLILGGALIILFMVGSVLLAIDVIVRMLS
jgi:hypothetical protein